MFLLLSLILSSLSMTPFSLDFSSIGSSTAEAGGLHCGYKVALVSDNSDIFRMLVLALSLLCRGKIEID